LLDKDKPKTIELYKSTYYISDVDRIAKETGLSKQLVRKCLSVFKTSFKLYLKTKMKRPLRISGVFTIYKKQYSKSSEQFKNWRTNDNNLQFKKK